MQKVERMRFYEIVNAFEAKKSGNGFKAKCPAHADSKPSLNIARGKIHETIVTCYAGCSVENILAAKGLQLTDLFDGENLVGDAHVYKEQKKVYSVPDYKPAELALDERVIEWFQDRGITSEVLLANKIEYRKVWMPQLGCETGAICFPYFRDGEVVNVKYRDGRKNFKMEKDAELILYGLDQIDLAEPLIWVEGEVDALSMDVVNCHNRVSVPNGAGNASSKHFERELSYLESAQDILSKVVAHVIAVDSDVPGRALQAELIRRLGPEKCYTVSWPDGCKDANDVLVRLGTARLRECLDDVTPVPVAGIYGIGEIEDDIIDLYRKPIAGGEYPGSDNLAKFYRPRVGEVSIVTGIPSMGKSRWLDWLIIQMAKNLGWQFAVCSPEHQPIQRHAGQLISCYLGKPFFDGYHERMDEPELITGIDWLKEHFSFLLPDEDMTIDNILELARIEVFRRGIKGLVIDPWNEFDHAKPKNLSTTEYIGKTLAKIRRFARRHQIHIWIVAHPFKMTKNKDGEYPVPTLYDISDSAHWFNKADMGVTIHRDKFDEEKPVDVHVLKVKFQENGHVGICPMYFDKLSGRYGDQPFVARPWSFTSDESH